MIEITSETIERAQTLLAGIPKGAERAFSSAINRGLSHTKTTAFKEVKKVYTVKQAALKEATRVSVRNASTGNLAGEVSFSGVKIPLYKFQVTPKEPGTKKKVRAAVMKGGGGTFDSAFIAKISAKQMIENTVIMDKLTQEAQEKVNERLAHEIERILNGYGG